MKKTEAIQLLGGSVRAAADAIGISSQAVSTWPDDLPQRIADRVQAALWRKQQAAALKPADADVTGPGALGEEAAA